MVVDGKWWQGVAMVDGGWQWVAMGSNMWQWIVVSGMRH